jgi:hypothetical protein
MHKSATKCNETLGKWCKNKHGASKIIDTLETYHGVTSDPSQPEHPCTWAGLSSSGAEVAVMLDEAILVAGIRRESRSPVMLVLSAAE